VNKKEKKRFYQEVADAIIIPIKEDIG